MNVKKRMTATTMMIAALTAITWRSSLITRQIHGFDEDSRTFDPYHANRRALRNKLSRRQDVDAPPVDGGDSCRAQKRRRGAGAAVQRTPVRAGDVIAALRRGERETPSPSVFRKPAHCERK